MMPSRKTQLASWGLATVGGVLAYANELFVALVVVALLLRSDLLVINPFVKITDQHPKLMSFGLAFVAGSTALLLWGLLYGGPKTLSQFGPNALWLCLSPLIVILCVHEAQLFIRRGGTQQAAAVRRP